MRFSLVAEIANISLANQVTQKSTSEFKTSEKIGSCHISNYSLSFFGNGMNGNEMEMLEQWFKLRLLDFVMWERSVNQKEKCFVLFLTLYCINFRIQVGRNERNYNNIPTLLLYYSKYSMVNLPSKFFRTVKLAATDS